MPSHGNEIISTKPRLKSFYVFFRFSVLFRCFIACLCCFWPYTIYFILLWHNIDCLCWKSTNQPNCFTRWHAVAQICRKICGSGSVRSSHQTFSHYTLRQRFPNTQRSRFLTACRRLEKLILPSTCDASLSSLMLWNLQSYTTTVLNERLWDFKGETYSYPSYIFSGGQDSQPQDLRPCRYFRAFVIRECSTSGGLI